MHMTVVCLCNASSRHQMRFSGCHSVIQLLPNPVVWYMCRYYKERPEWWAEVSRRNMQLDSSWGRSSEAYLELYRTMGQS